MLSAVFAGNLPPGTLNVVVFSGKTTGCTTPLETTPRLPTDPRSVSASFVSMDPALDVKWMFRAPGSSASPLMVIFLFGTSMTILAEKPPDPSSTTTGLIGIVLPVADNVKFYHR